ncbi:MAG: hypothetical protein HC880_20305 [Bacteroidia bacterium]|nr:hypothetical protein [Bacteroidia bacterium]
MNQAQIEHYRKKIVGSECFAKSLTGQRLLDYLVESTLRDESPKEYTIGAEVFSRKYKEGKEPNIRVYVHNLRKKLDEYYEGEGQVDQLRFRIPKGQYRIEFKEQKPDEETPLPSTLPPYRRYVFALLALCLVIGLGWLGWQFYSATTIPATIGQSLVWRSFLQSNKPTLLVIGDHYMFNAPLHTGRTGASRDFLINSDQDLDAYLKENPDKMNGIARTSHTYLTKQGPFSLFHLLPLFIQHGQSPQLRLASETTLDDLKNQNMVFIGSYKTLGKLSPIADRLLFDFDVKNITLRYNDRPSDSVITYQYDPWEKISRDYALVAFFMSENRQSYIFFLSNHDIGNIATTQYFSNAQKLAAFTEQLSPGSKGFKCLFEVKGMGRTDFSLELIRYEDWDTAMEGLW